MTSATFISRVAMRIDAHLALFVTAAASLLVVLKVFEAGRYEPSTALAIVQAGSSATLLIGISVALLPTLMAGLLGLSFGVLIGLKQLHQPIWYWVPALLATVFLAVAAVTLGTLIAFAVLVLITPLPLMWRWATKRTEVRDSEPAPTLSSTWYWRALIWILPVFILVSVLTPSPWPTEDIQTGSGTLTVFVIEAEGDWWTVLGVADRRISHLESEEVRSRKVCRAPTATVLPEWTRLTLPQLGAEPMPRCGR